MNANPLDDCCVVIPTFNEADNIVRLLESLRALSPGLRLLVVDDGSPDGTAAAARAQARRLAPLTVVDRGGKGGRGSACLFGFQEALKEPSIRYFVEMDADFSHDPASLPDIVGALAGVGEDVAVSSGSRYLPESRIVGWPPARHILSFFSNKFARRMLGIPMTDYTNGYRAYTRKALEALDFSRIQAKGYIVLSEVAYQLHLKGFSIIERPIVFVNRRRGESNLTWREVWGALTSVLTLRQSYADLRVAAKSDAAAAVK